MCSDKNWLLVRRSFDLPPSKTSFAWLKQRQREFGEGAIEQKFRHRGKNELTSTMINYVKIHSVTNFGTESRSVGMFGDEISLAIDHMLGAKRRSEYWLGGGGVAHVVPLFHGLFLLADRF